jgi:glycosyltransferase involved in cell wall biosynthesis
MKISLCVPFIDTWDITKHCIEKIVENTTEPIELIMIDNGSDINYKDQIKKLVDNGMFEFVYKRNQENIGVLPTFKQGFEIATGDIICFIHSDVLLQEKGWDIKVRQAFESNPQLGLAGIFGAVGVGSNGGRIRSQSNILGLEWGKCECHSEAWQHHSEHQTGLSPATILDGVGMFFSRQALESLTQTDMFDSWRAPHHFYDRIIPLKLIDRGFKIATIGIGFDHWSGATANSSNTYIDTMTQWLKSHNMYNPNEAPDKQIYDIAEQQFFREFVNRLPCTVDSNWNYIWTGVL